MTTNPAAGDRPEFHGGVNIAMKLPRAEFERTVAFYRDALGLKVTDRPGEAETVSRSVTVAYGPITLWLDLVDTYARSDVWFELLAEDLPRAMDHLACHGVQTRDELEPLPAGLEGHWISNPAGVIHLVRAG